MDFGQQIQLIISFCVVHIFLIEQGKSKLCLEIARNQLQQCLIVKPCKVVASQFLIGIGAEIECRRVLWIEAKHIVVFVLCQLPLLKQQVDASLFQSEVCRVGMILHLVGGTPQRITQLFKALCLQTSSQKHKAHE